MKEIKITITGDDDMEIEIIANVGDGEAEVRYYADGSGHPGCDPEVEIVSAIDEEGNTRTLSARETEKAVEKAFEMTADGTEDDSGGWEDWRE